MSVNLEGFIPVGHILKSGIYALIYHGEVVYIGKSKKMLSRIYTHKNLWGRKALSLKSFPFTTVKGILFDDVHVLPCRLEVIDELERELIALYKPKHNINLKSPGMITVPITLKHGNIELVLNGDRKVRPEPTIRIERRL